jgi:tRNA A-37 threonylcarbamoyl transferase component Bud32
MDYNKLQNLSYSQLKELTRIMELPPKRNKNDIINSIIPCFQEWEEYRKHKIEHWQYIKQLGEKGKEGTTFLVKTDKFSSKETYYAMKTFNKKKSPQKLILEATLQQKASEVGVAPQIVDIDPISKTITMQCMDKHLWDMLMKTRQLSTNQQRQIISIYKKLDKINIFHGDANLMNYMYQGKKLYMIDFGMSREINTTLIKKLGTKTPNLTIMTLGLILKLKKMQFNPNSWEYLKQFLTTEQKLQFSL